LPRHRKNAHRFADVTAIWKARYGRLTTSRSIQRQARWHHGLYIVDANGKNCRQITNDEYGDLHPAGLQMGSGSRLPPIGVPRRIFRPEVFHMAHRRNGLRSGAIEVLPNQGGLNLNPAWSPDGGSSRSSPMYRNPHIFPFRLRRSTAYQLTNVLAVYRRSRSSARDKLGKDADRIAYTSFERGDYDHLDHRTIRERSENAFRPSA